ncbi:MAG: O-antigen ligase family protein [Oscillospiraceae bacterium]|jgi:O-antigen ligase|nr:O-antigen ligase family protein [Oscillospiraceae bacterium]
MTYKDSYFWQICLYVYGFIRESLIVTKLAAFGAWLKRRFGESVLSAALRHEGVISCDFGGSLFVRAISAAVNFPAWLCVRLYALKPELWDGSAVIRALRYFGTHTEALFALLFVLIFSVPQENWDNWYSSYAAAAILLIFVVGSVKKQPNILDVRRAGAWAVAFAALTAVAMLTSVSVGGSLRFFVFHFTDMVCVIVMISGIRTMRQLKYVAGFALLGTAIASVAGFAQRIEGIDVNASFTDLAANKYMPGRVFSFFDNPNTFAMVLVMFIPLALGLFCYGKGVRMKLYSLAVFVLATGALLMTYSRGAWIGYAGSLGLFILIVRPMLAPLPVLGFILAFPFLPRAIADRVLTIFNSGDSSISSRTEIYSAGLRVFAARPIQGAGLGSDAVQQYVRENGLFLSNAKFTHSHNLYIQIAAETGVFGILAFLGAMLQTFKRAFAELGADKERKAIIAGGVSGLFGVLVCAVADYPWFYPRVMLMFWLLFGIIVAATGIPPNGGEVND